MSLVVAVMAMGQLNDTTLFVVVVKKAPLLSPFHIIPVTGSVYPSPPTLMRTGSVGVGAGKAGAVVTTGKISIPLRAGFSTLFLNSIVMDPVSTLFVSDVNIYAVLS